MGDSTTNGERRVEYEAAKRKVMEDLNIKTSAPIDEHFISRMEKMKKKGMAKYECPVCHEKFKIGDTFVAHPIQAWGDRGPRDIVVKAILIHEMCFFPFGGGE